MTFDPVPWPTPGGEQYALGSWPATPGEWAAASLRFLVNARMLRTVMTAETVREVHVAILRAVKLVERADQGGVVEAVELASIYGLCVRLEVIFVLAFMPRAGLEAGWLCRRYREITTVGCGLLPLPKLEV